METALFAQHGPAGLVQQVALATQHGLPHQAEQCLRAMIRIQTLGDHRAAFRAGGPWVIALCLETFPTSLGLARAALIAGLFRSWRGGIAPFHGAPTKRVVKAICKAMKTFKHDLLVVNGGLRLLKLHASSTYRLVETPAVVETVAESMRTFPNNDPVQHFGAHAIAAINGVEPCDLKAAHGEMGYNAIAVTSVAMAVESPPSLRIGNQSWQQVVLAVYPRLRERA